MSTVCPVHQLPWKWIPAGVSKKTGNAYTAFATCQVQGCDQKPAKEAAPPAPRATAAPPAPSNGSQPSNPAPHPAVTRLRCAEAALAASARFYAGTGVSEDQVIAFAARLHHRFLMAAMSGTLPAPSERVVPPSPGEDPDGDLAELNR